MDQADGEKTTCLTYACKICGGVLIHETWCVVLLSKPVPDLSEEDEIRLAGMGATWSRK